MSILEKYAREPTERLTKQYNVKLSETDGTEFEQYCKILNLTTGEALRYLVIDELNRKRTKEKLQVSKEKTGGDSKVPEELTKKSEGISKGSSDYLKRFKVDNQLPCPICKTWSSSGHFSGRHAKKHGFNSTYEFFKAHEDQALEMVKAGYDPYV